MSKKDELIKSRDLLQKERKDLKNKRVSKIKLSLYVWGIALTTVISSLFFLESAPVLIYLFSFLFTFGVPCIYYCKNILKDNELKDKITGLDKDIIDIENEEKRKEMLSRNSKPLSFKKIEDKRDYLGVINDGLKKIEHINIGSDSEICLSDENVEKGPSLKFKKN